MFNSQKKSNDSTTNAFSLNENKYRKVIEKPYEMFTYNDFEIYVNE